MLNKSTKTIHLRVIALVRLVITTIVYLPSNILMNWASYWISQQKKNHRDNVYATID